MSVQVVIIDGSLPPTRDVAIDGLFAGRVGANLLFEGVARSLEAGQTIAALEYEAYEPMASRQLHALGEEMVERHGVLAVFVEHSRGRVPVGACSFRVRILSAHRKEAIAALDEFVDRMKRDVPIWKHAVGE